MWLCVSVSLVVVEGLCVCVCWRLERWVVRAGGKEGTTGLLFRAELLLDLRFIALVVCVILVIVTIAAIV